MPARKAGSRAKTSAKRASSSSSRGKSGAPRKGPQRKASGKSSEKYWSQAVTTRSDALDLESGVFAQSKPADIARSLKRSAEASKRRKGTPYQSAMSMLNFYMNRAGKNLPESRKRVLERAKDALRKEFRRG
jgi:putative cell wall-binding protein